MIYARISDDTTGNAAGVDRQVTDCRKFAADRGWTVVGEPRVDNDISASRYATKERPAYKDVIGLVESGAVTAVVAWHIDRLYRQPKELERLIELAERGVIVATPHGDIDLTTAEGIVMARIAVAIAAKSSDDTSRRLRDFKRHKADAGLPAGGSRAFGYEPDGMTIIPAEAKLIRSGAARILAGETMTAVAHGWNKAGMLTPKKGIRFGVGSVRTILTNPRYAGLRVHQGTVVGDAAWPPIIDRDTHERLVHVLTDPSRRIKNPPRRSLLTGIIRCECGATMRRFNKKTGPGYYRCRQKVEDDACGQVAIRAGDVDAAVVEAVIDVISSRKFAARLNKKPTTSGSVREVQKLERRQDDLLTMFTAGDIPKRMFVNGARELEAKITAERARVVADNSGSVFDGYDGTNATAWWQTLSVDRRRAVIAFVLPSVTVRPSSTSVASEFHPDRLVPDWSE